MSLRKCRFVGSGVGCLKLIMATAGVLCLGTAARGALVLDQQHVFTDHDDIETTASGDIEVGQTFTVGIGGTLAQIDVLMYGAVFDADDLPLAADPVLRVYETSGGLPTGTALATVTIPKEQVVLVTLFDDAPTLGPDDMVSFDVSSAGITVNPGDVLAFSITTVPNRVSYKLLTEDDNGEASDYTAGELVKQTLDPLDPEPWYSRPGFDMGFRVWVEPIPEPATAMLLLAGATTACLLRRSSRG